MKKIVALLLAIIIVACVFVGCQKTDTPPTETKNTQQDKVIYDRAYLAISPEKPGNVDWEKVFEGVDWFHITGITPAISKSAMEPFLESVKEAKKRNITVSCDLNYRKNL